MGIVSSKPDIPFADAPTGMQEFAREYKENTDDTLTRLKQRLEQAEQERVWLAERIAALEAITGESETYPDTEAGIPSTVANEVTESTASPQSFRTSVEALIETGIPAEQAALIQARLDEYDLKQLYLQDLASREGWLNTARYGKEQREARNAYQELRLEIGDDAYDRMLYALGRTNRVVVRDIMQNSTAEQYDLRANDRIIEYDGRRVFTGYELNMLVTKGTTGAPVLLRVQRDEQQLEFYLPQGPIGIRLAASREQP
ncbi:MAG: PDZ domain-containing protein [Gammaproteobacteria bacterium]